MADAPKPLTPEVSALRAALHLISNNAHTQGQAWCAKIAADAIEASRASRTALAAAPAEHPLGVRLYECWEMLCPWLAAISSSIDDPQEREDFCAAKENLRERIRLAKQELDRLTASTAAAVPTDKDGGR